MMNRRIKPSIAFSLAFLVLHLSMVTFSREWVCDCDKHRDKMTYCCNCPACVEERGGLVSYCQLPNKTYNNDKKGDHSLKSPNCMCGSERAIFHLPNDFPFLSVQNPDHFSLISLSSLKMENVKLELDDFVLPHEYPG